MNEKNFTIKEIEKHFKEIISLLGEDPTREGLRNTPKRAAQALQHLTSGYSSNIDNIINNAVFKSPNKSMVVVKQIEFHSLCEHHILPFSGTVNIGYIPNGQVIGLSKIPRIIDHYSRRLQIQENLTEQIAQAVWQHTDSKGAIAIIEAKHSCLCMRGVGKQKASMISTAYNGLFEKSYELREEFFNTCRS